MNKEGNLNNKLRFGPSGNSELFYKEGNKSSLQAPQWLKQKGLSAYEYSFTRGFTIKNETAILLGEKAQENDRQGHKAEQKLHEHVEL